MTSPSRPESALAFISYTPQGPSDPDARKTIRSHVMRGKNRRRPRPRMASWMSGELQRRPRPETTSAVQAALPMPRHVGSVLSFTTFPDDMEPYMLQDVVHFLNIVKKALYPFEAILMSDKRESFWYNNLTVDSAYLHSVIFSSQTYYDSMRGNTSNPVAVKHLIKALKIVAERMSLGGSDATSNATISAVVSLAMAAYFFGDYEAGEMHMKGLYKIVSLRGGLSAFKGDAHGIQSKVCRVDLGYSLCTGQKPLFFADRIPWDSYIATHPPIANFDPPPPPDGVANVTRFLESLDWRLVNVWRDLYHFSQLGNLAAQTGRRLQHDAFHEMMASIHYRLLHLSLDDSPAQEAVRLGMLAFAATVFLQWVGMRLRFHCLGDTLERALRRLRDEVQDAPPWLVVWLIISGHIVVIQEAEGTWMHELLSETLGRLGPPSWDQARDMLRGIMWIDLLYDTPGRAIFEEAVARLKGQETASPALEPG
ncbi:hypothetical protein VTK73DRAFT_7355 [Phialemonium thermophilum]|uniref:Uncharacterized protein n=1 Tax=Phialemonium thermophilum TaxID=223376 RepID=A0ABR3WEY2_9PEZI